MTDICYANPYPYAGLSNGWWHRIPIEVAPGGAATPPATDGEPRTKGQTNWLRPLGYGVPGFCVPGLPPAIPGDYPVWRAMDADPGLCIASGAITAPIREAGHSWEAREGTSDAWVQQVQSTFDPLWDEWLRETLDMLRMGWKPFEVVLGRRDGATVVVDLPPLSQELSGVLTRDGVFAGVRNNRGRDVTSIDLLGPACMVVTCDQKNRDKYGRPWHENARQTWWSKLHVMADLVRLNKKASGIQASGYYPPAADESTNHTNEKAMQELLKRYMAGDGVVLPNAAGLLNSDLAADFRNIQGMAEAAIWKIQLEDHGDMGPQAAALLEQLKYHNTDLARAWHVPERSIAEANTAGSRADSETHTDIAKAMSQLVFNDAVTELNRGPIDTMLVQNYGEKARGAVKAKAGMLRDIYATGDWILIQAVLAEPDLLFAVAEQVDLDAVFTRRGIPKTKGVMTLTDAIAEAKKSKDAAASAAQNAPPVPGTNGNGFNRMNGQLGLTRAAQAKAEQFVDGFALLGRLAGED